MIISWQRAGKVPKLGVLKLNGYGVFIQLVSPKCELLINYDFMYLFLSVLNLSVCHSWSRLQNQMSDQSGSLRAKCLQEALEWWYVCSAALGKSRGSAKTWELCSSPGLPSRVRIVITFPSRRSSLPLSEPTFIAAISKGIIFLVWTASAGLFVLWTRIQPCTVMYCNWLHCTALHWTESVPRREGGVQGNTSMRSRELPRPNAGIFLYSLIEVKVHTLSNLYKWWSPSHSHSYA